MQSLHRQLAAPSLQRPAPRSAGLLFALAALLGAPPAADAIGPHDRRMTHARSGISVEAPAGWTLSQPAGYADTVVLFVHPDGSRISVTAAITNARDADSLYKQNRPGLVAQGLVPTPLGPGARGSLAVDLSAAGKPDQMRQLYLVRDVPLGRQAIVLTLIASARSLPARAAALDFVATRMTLGDPLVSSGSSRPRSAAGGATGTAGTVGP